VSGDWQNEDDIKAELRTLTSQVRKLREELRNMVEPPKPNPSRAFLHRQSWPTTPPTASDDKRRAPQPPRRAKKSR
jgi:hypothetical protein